MTDNKKEASVNGKVFIKMSAFKDMLSHVLRFSNISLEYNDQVMGFCIGSREPNNNIIVNRVIPIIHGDIVELGFSEKIHKVLVQTKEDVVNENFELLGWYHSHPASKTFFFSDVDKKNHLYFQNEDNPNAFGIIFDHSKLQKGSNFGLEVFRLKDPKKGEKSDTIKVKYEIEAPTSLDFYRWVQKLVEYGQMRNPIIIREKLEVNDQAPSDLQEIPMSVGELDSDLELKYPNIEPVVEGVKKGLQNFSNLVLNNYKTELETWSTEFNDGALIGLKKISDSLAHMILAINNGFEKVEKWVDINFKERIDEYKGKIEGYVKKRLEGQEELKTNTGKIKESLANEINKNLEKSIESISKSIKKDLNETINKLYELSMQDKKIKERIEKSTNQISNLTYLIENLSIDILKGISAINHPFEINLSTNYDKLISELELFDKDFGELEELIERLQSIIPDFRNVKK
jgi:proteasome lid subunit RPN8/RPN11